MNARVCCFCQEERTRERKREWARQQRQDPEFRARQVAATVRWQKRHPGTVAEVRKRYYVKMRDSDPERYARMRERNNARSREWYERVRSDPVAYAELLKERRLHKTRAKLRRRFTVLLLGILRAELERRETEARAHREHVRERNAAWLEHRRAAWARGEFENLEPVFAANGDLRWLPAAPLAAWLRKLPVSLEEVAARARINSRALRRYTDGETVMVSLEVVDTLAVRMNVLLLDIYPPDRFPRLYE